MHVVFWSYLDGEDSLVLGDVAGLEFRGHVARIQRQMIALLPRYCFSDRLQAQIRNLLVEGASTDDSNTVASIQLTVEQIAANVTSFCRALVSNSGKSPERNMTVHVYYPSRTTRTSSHK